MVMQNLKAQKIVRKDNILVFQECLNKVFSGKQVIINDKSFQIALHQLIELYDSRTVLTGMQAIVSSIKDFNVNEAKTKLKELSKITHLKQDDRVGEWTEDYESRIEIVNQRASSTSEDGTHIVGVPTGIRRFDAEIGGLLPGEFGVIAGRPSIGKTAMLVDLATSAYVNGYNVLFASGEMSKVDIQFRMDANLAGVPSKEFRTGVLSKQSQQAWNRTITKFRTISQNFLEVCAFPRNFSTNDIENEISRLQDKHEKQVHLLCIDYLNIMNSVGSHSNGKDWESQSDAVWDVKGLISEINGGIVGWTAGQIIDAAFEVDQLELQHLKYARAISETSPIVVGLVRTPDDELEGRIQLQIMKVRNAEKLVHPIYLHPNMELMRLHEQVVNKKNLLCLEDDVGEKKTLHKRKEWKK
jgi:hypothetical protein